MFSSVLTVTFLFQSGLYLGISISSYDFSTWIQMMMNDDKTYLHSQLIAVAFQKLCNNAFYGYKFLSVCPALFGRQVINSCRQAAWTIVVWKG